MCVLHKPHYGNFSVSNLMTNITLNPVWSLLTHISETKELP
jgi:hypothetical protein